METPDVVINILRDAQNALIAHQLSLLDQSQNPPLARLFEIQEANAVYDKLSKLIAKVHESR